LSILNYAITSALRKRLRASIKCLALEVIKRILNNLPEWSKSNGKLTAPTRAARVNIKPLKAFALEKLPDCALKDLLLADQDFLNVHEFLVKTQIYLRLLRRIR